MKTDYILNDVGFKALAAMLDKCAAEHGGCENCFHFENCQQAFDLLADISDKKMTSQDRARFEARYFNKQTTFV